MKCVYCNTKDRVAFCKWCKQTICSLCDMLEAPINPYTKDTQGNVIEICHVSKEAK